MHKKGAKLKLWIKSTALIAVFKGFFSSIIPCHKDIPKLSCHEVVHLKSSRLPMIAGVAVAIALALIALIADTLHRARIENSLQDFLNGLSLPLLERGDPAPLFGHLDAGVELPSPDVGFITRYLPLIELSPWEGDVQVPSLYDSGQASAIVSTRAHYSRGTADIQAAAVHHEGQWHIRQYEVIAGPPAQ